MNTKKNSDQLNTSTVINKLGQIIDDSMIKSSFVDELKIYSLNNINYVVFVTKNDQKFMIKNYSEAIDEAMKHAFGVNIKYEITNQDEFKNVLKTIDINEQIKESNLNNRYQLSNYIEAKFNKKIIALGKKLINQEKTFYNPIFIHSSSGLGKTHFLNAIGNEIIKKGKNVCYINPDQFIKKVTQYLIHSNQDKLSEIIDFYKDFDVLLFDDVQQYGSKPATLNVLFNILNHHIEKDNQIVIVADKSPELLGGFEERFITRFQGGITEEITPPSLDDLMIIFKEKLIQSNIDPADWEDEAIKFIIRNHSASIRTLEGAINKIEWNKQNDVQHIKYTIQTVKQIFNSIAKQNHQSISPERIIEIVSKYYGINKNEVLGKSRRQDVVIARHISMWFIRNLLDKTYKEIGTIFKGRDHSTVLSAIEKIEYQMKINETVKNTLKIIREKINQD